MEDPQAATSIERAIDNLVDELVLVKSAVNRREAHDTIRDTVEDLFVETLPRWSVSQAVTLSVGTSSSTPYQE